VRAVLAVLAAAACVVLLAGCGTGGEGTRLTAGEVTVLVSAPPDAGMDALGGGRIEVVDGCLGADGAVIIWPHGTELVSEVPVRIDVPEVGTVGPGDRVELAGGYVFEPETPGETYESDLVPETCADRPVFLAR
jgi:hypothetical protein